MKNKLILPEVTLVAVTSIEIDATQEALINSASGIEFGAVKLLASRSPNRPAPGIELIQISPVDLVGYSRFMLFDLCKYIDTPYCLVIQSDGYVIDPSLWSDEFLMYDYIGAPWPEFVYVLPEQTKYHLDRNSVGNGGFSLRSRALLEATVAIDIDGLGLSTIPEDLVICHFLYEDMLAKGLHFAPPEVAARFALESRAGFLGSSIDTVFGFHGKHLLASAARRFMEVAGEVDSGTDRARTGMVQT